MPADEIANFQSFLAGPGGKGRYRHLLGLERYAQADAIRAGEPSNGFNQQVLDQIGVMVTEEILRHPAYTRLKWAFAAAVQGCDDIASYVPQAERQGYPVTVEAVRKETRQKNAKAGPSVIALRWLFESHKLPTGHWSPSLRTRWVFRRGDGIPDDLDVRKPFAARSGLGELPSCADLRERASGAAAP